MIVKDESRVIERSLASVRDYIDYWVIVDTGSTDDTKEKIETYLSDIPGELHERPWKSFRHNRDEALELARDHADYLLFTDASLVWTPEEGFAFPELTKDVYYVRLRARSRSLSWKLKMLASAKKPWYYHGEAHSVLVCDEPFEFDLLNGIYIHAPGDGARRSSANAQDKYFRDINTFQRALKRNPLDPRATFFLAQSYRDAGNFTLALEWFRKRAALGHDAEEAWFSLLQIGIIKQEMNRPWEEVERAFLAAYEAAPWRSEPLYPICEHYRKTQDFDKSYVFAKKGIAIPYPQDAISYVEDSVYEWRMLYEYAVAAYCIGKYNEAAKSFETLLREGKVPDKERDRVRENLKYALTGAAGS